MSGADRDIGAMIVLGKAAEGRSDELVDWYVSQHLRDLLDVPGINRTRLWRLENLMEPTPAAYTTLGIYDIVAPDVRAVVREAAARMQSGRMPRSTALGGPNISLLARPIVSYSSGD